MRLFLCCTIALFLCACGTPRRFGDTAGKPVDVHVTLSRDYVRGLSSRQVRTSVGAGASFGSGGSRSTGVGLGLSFSATTVTLAGGEGPAEGQIFRKTLEWGEQTFTVPLTPGRTLHLTVHASGGYDGWESIGSVVIPAEGDAKIDIVLSGDSISATVR